MTDRVAKDKYAVGEYERRFLLSSVPAEARDPRRIVDHYIDGTRLRLRSVSDDDGRVTQKKLGHKRRVEATDPTAIMCTSVYLDDAEFDVLAGLPGRALEKTRWAVQVSQHAGAVDEFGGALRGLILLEVDLGSPAELADFAPPSWVGDEVTSDEALTGGQLAGKCLDDIESPHLRR